MFKKVLFITLVLFALVFPQMAEKCFADAPAQLKQAQTYVEDRYYEQAEAIYKSIIQNYSATDDALEAQRKLTQLYIFWEKEPEAEAAFQAVIAEFSQEESTPEAVVQVADIYCGLGKHKEALELYQYCPNTWPDGEQAIRLPLGMAISNIALGNDSDAQAAIEKLLAEFSDSEHIAEAVADIAERYRKSGRYEEAVQFYQYALANWPGSEESMWSQAGLARSNIALGDEPNAQAAIDKLLTEFSDNNGIAEAIREIADEYLSLEKYEKAKQVFQYVLDNRPRSEEAIWSHAGIAMSKIGVDDNANALAAVDSLLVDFNDHPYLPDVICKIEEEYYKRILAAEQNFIEDFSHPIVVWEKVTEKFPDLSHNDPDLYYFVADCYRQLGEYEKAIEYYGIVAAKWTQNGYAVLSNAVVPRAEDNAVGDYEALHEVIDRLIADFGDHPGLACVVTRSGHGYRRRANDAQREGLSTEAEANHFKAIGLYDRVINEFGSSPFVASSYFFSALCYRDLGQWQDALDCCNHLLDNWPDYKDAPWARRLAQGCSEKLPAQVQ